MANCETPLTAYRQANGRISFVRDSSVTPEIQLPCGRCTLCRTRRIQDWAIRSAHEASLYPRSSFVTLTYAPGSLPPGGSLDWSHVASFLKRLRRRISYKSNRRLRYYASGEYGEKNRRPHYHLLIFGYCPDDLVVAPPSNRGHAQFHSGLLSDCWSKGLVVCAPVERYDAKSVGAYLTTYLNNSHDANDRKYLERVDPSTGEVYQVAPEFNRMSSRPGIGASWLDEFEMDLQHGYLLHDTRKLPIPTYYRRRLKATHPALHARIMEQSSKHLASLDPENSSPSRIADKALIVRSKKRNKD